MYEIDQPLIYLHIWPRNKIAPLPVKVLHDLDKSSIEPLCGTLHGWSNSRNRFGQIAWAYDPEYKLGASTQVFGTGEIWGVNRSVLAPRHQLPNPVAIGQFEQALRKSLHAYVSATRTHFGYGAQIQVRFGLVNVSGFRLGLPNGTITDSDHQIFYDVNLTRLINMDESGAVDNVLTEIFAAVYEAAGLARLLL